MNDVSNITGKILDEANAWASAHLEEAAAEIQAIRAGYEQSAAEQSETLLAEAGEKAEAIRERSRSQAEMEHRKQVLTTKQAAVQQAFDQALTRLCGLSVEERTLLMVRMALKYQTADAELIFCRADQELVGPAVVDTLNSLRKKQQFKETFSGPILEQLKKLVVEQPDRLECTLSSKVGEFAGGFILKQGSIEHNCTFEVLVSAVRDELEGEVSSLLFQ